MLKPTTAALLASAALAQQPPPPGYDAELWQRALRVHHEAIVVDTHSDTTSLILDDGYDIGERHDYAHMDLPRIFEGGLDAQFYAIYVSSRYFGDEDTSSREALAASTPNASARRALDMIDAFYRSVDANPEMAACFSVADLREAAQDGKHAALMGIEGGHAIEGDLALLRMFHRLGVRYMTLTHSNHNHFADSSGEAAPKWGGLNTLGHKVVLEMNRLGMMVDLSHVSDATFRDAIAITRAPVILSHSSCRALCGHPRNVTDAMLRALADNGGVIMINYNCGFVDDEYAKRRSAYFANFRLREQQILERHPEGSEEREQEMARLRERFPQPEPPELETLMQHFLHAIEVAGVDHVGLGSDFDGVPCVPRGLEDVTKLPRITYRLLQAGLSEREVEQVLGGNLLRVFGEVERVAESLAGEPPHRNDPATDHTPITR